MFTNLTLSDIELGCSRTIKVTSDDVSGLPKYDFILVLGNNTCLNFIPSETYAFEMRDPELDMSRSLKMKI